MKKPLVIKNSITIKASQEKIWDILVHPEQTRKYMFGCETVSDWKPGSELLWRGTWEGKSMVFVKGSIVSIEPNRFLAYTTFDPNSAALADMPENYLTVTYTLKNLVDATELTVTQGDYSTVGDGERRYADTMGTGDGWNPILVQIRNLAEA
jgi:uncharacterized protein YndB with AHSA1/START domain